MMRMNNIKLTVHILRTDLLTRLQANYERHRQIVREAQRGYLEQAKRALEERLADLAAGKKINLQFRLTPPADFTEVYASVIQMLELSQDEQILLSPDECRQLVEDKWDWTDNFLASNRHYSAMAGRMIAASEAAGSACGEDEEVGGASAGG